MEKFRYAPGKPGFGGKGSDGSVGIQGLSMYFTDYDPLTTKPLIDAAIQNNYTLWSGSTTTLPDGRVYVTGDLFVDGLGKVYEIDVEAGTFRDTFGVLNISGYFTSAQVSSSDGFNRYYNTNIYPKYIIDNVYTDGTPVAYYNIPTEIYNIMPIDFTRIEYSNVAQGNYNPFTVYSAAKIEDTDFNSEAIAIVREISSNTFRIGNIDSNGNVRNVNLMFDVKSLSQIKQAANVFSYDTPEGTILTNYEINANALFDGVFSSSPASFYATYSSTDVSIFWNLAHFTPDTDIKADLYVYRDISTNGQTFNLSIDTSQLWPYVFSDIDPVASLNLTGIAENTAFKYYINFSKNGWQRYSTVKSVTTQPTPYLVVDPSLTRESSGGHYVAFCVSSNVEWSARSVAGTFIRDISTDYAYPASDTSMYAGLTENIDCPPRTGIIEISSTIMGGNSPIYATIIQNGICVPVTVTLTDDSSSYGAGNSPTRVDKTKNSSINISDIPADTTFDVSVNYTLEIRNYYSYSDNYITNINLPVAYDNTYIELTANGKSNAYSHIPPQWMGSCTSGTTDTTTGTFSMFDVSLGNLPISATLKTYAYLNGSALHYRFYVKASIDSIYITRKTGTLIYPTYIILPTNGVIDELRTN